MNLHDRYVIKSLLHASEVLWAFQHPGETLRLRDVMTRTGFGKGMCFRLLHTLHHCGLLEKVDASRYRLVSPVQRRKRYRLGYGAQGQDTSFAREVRGSLERAAEREGAELIVVDNRYQAKVALRNAEHLIREGVDLVIEFQTDEAVAAAIAAKYLETLKEMTSGKDNKVVYVPFEATAVLGALGSMKNLFDRNTPPPANPKA